MQKIIYNLANAHLGLGVFRDMIVMFNLKNIKAETLTTKILDTFKNMHAVVAKTFNQSFLYRENKLYIN